MPVLIIFSNELNLIHNWQGLRYNMRELKQRRRRRRSTYLTPTLNGGGRGGVRTVLLSQVTLFEYNVLTILLPIVG